MKPNQKLQQSAPQRRATAPVPVRAAPRPPRLPEPRVLERISWGLAVLAALAQVISQIILVTELGAVVSLAMQFAGWGLSRWRRWPGLVLLFLAPGVAASLGSDPLIAWTIVVIAAFAFVVNGMSPLGVGAAAVAGNYGAVLIAHGYMPTDPEALAAAATSIAAVAIAAALRAQYRWFAAVQEHTASAIATRDVEANRRVAEERLRIARDLHDGVGHEVAGLSMQLGLAEVSLPDGAETAREALHGARRRVKSITEETQRILDVLRLGDEEQDLSPVADVHSIRDLVDSFASIGLTVEARIGEFPAAVGLNASIAAYRIVQEALTNAYRHGTGSATLSAGIDGASLAITITNPIRTADVGGRRGYGLVGMRERVQSAHGRVELTEKDGVFRVHVRLPVEAEELS